MRPKLLALLLALTLARGLIYAAVIPPWQAPDENGHFEYAWLIAHLGRLPTRKDVSPFFERELIGSLYEWRYAQFIGRSLPEQMPARIDDLPPGILARNSRTVLGERFSLAYIWMAFFIWPFRHQDLVVQLYAARFASVMLELGIVWLAWRIFQELLPRQQWLAVAMTAFVVFLPQHTFINASAGNGSLAELAAYVVLYGWLRLFRRAGAWGVVAIVGGTLIGMWTKKTAGFLLPFNMLALVLLLVARYRGAAHRRQWGPLALGLVLIALVGWLALQTPVGLVMRNRLQQWWSTPQLHLADEPMPVGKALLQTYDSFWGQFGWMGARAGDGWYNLIYILTAFAVAGWILPRAHCWSAPAQAKGLLAASLLVAVDVWLASMFFTNSIGHSQGRYLFSVTVPAAFFLVAGWARWMPAQWQQRYFAPGAVLLLAALDAAAIYQAIWPYFYRIGA